MKKQTKTKKLHTKLESIRALVTDQLGNVNGGSGTVRHAMKDDDSSEFTGCPCRTQ